MSPPRLLTGLAEVADRYDALLCDVWGVIHNGVDRFERACDALQRFQDERGPVVLISNSPRPSKDVLPQLAALKVPSSIWSAFVSSGDVTRRLLAERSPGPAWRIGPDRDLSLYDGLGLAFTGPEDASFISCTGPVNDEEETPEDYRQSLSIAAARGLTMICANPDRVVQRGDRLIFCGGALAEFYAALGGPVVMAGKPFSPIYEEGIREITRLAGRSLDQTRILAVGDGIPTDVLGANRQALDCLFIADGIHAVEASGEDGRLDAQRLAMRLAKDEVYAAYALAGLGW